MRYVISYTRTLGGMGADHPCTEPFEAESDEEAEKRGYAILPPIGSIHASLYREEGSGWQKIKKLL